jgi:hypothetical protein
MKGFVTYSLEEGFVNLNLIKVNLDVVMKFHGYKNRTNKLNTDFMT